MAEKGADSGVRTEDPTRDNQEHELEAEEESAQAMDAEVSHGADGPEATEGRRP